jgi:hypothetical protein
VLLHNEDALGGLGILAK